MMAPTTILKNPGYLGKKPWLSRKETVAIPERNPGYPRKKPWLSQKETGYPGKKPGYPGKKPWLSQTETLAILERNPGYPGKNPCYPERNPAIPEKNLAILERNPAIQERNPGYPTTKKHISNSNSRNNLSLPKLLTNIVYHVELSCKWQKFLNEDNSYFCQ